MSVPDWKLERMLLGEIAPEGLDEREREKLEGLRRENEEILAAHPPEQVVAEIERRRAQAALQEQDRSDRTHRPERRLLLALGPALAAAAVAVAVFVPLPQETERSKGAAPYLVIHRHAGDRADRLEAGAEVRAHDVLQLSYVSLGRPYGVIFSIDGRGVVTLHHPASEAAAQELADLDGAVPLPNAYELDDAPEFERFFFVTASTPMDVGALLERARRGELSGLEVSSFLLRKGSAP
jgi:hypothetical protein